MRSLFQILFLNLKNKKVSSFKLGQDITKKIRLSKNTFSDAPSHSSEKKNTDNVETNQPISNDRGTGAILTKKSKLL